MNEQNFKKEIDSLKKIGLTSEEKSRILENVLKAPIASPYVVISTFFSPVFKLVHVRTVTAASFVVLVSFSGMAYASDYSLPGDVLYSMKVSVVEPVLDRFNSSVEKKVVWEEEKVERRIREAEALLKLEKLDDVRTDELERRVEQSSKAFISAVKEQARTKAAGIVAEEVEREAEIEVEVERRRQEFREKFGFKAKASSAALTKEVGGTVESSDTVEPVESTDPDETVEPAESEDRVEPVDENRQERIERLKRKAFEVIEDREED